LDIVIWQGENATGARRSFVGGTSKRHTANVMAEFYQPPLLGRDPQTSYDIAFTGVFVAARREEKSRRWRDGERDQSPRYNRRPRPY
jgi:hypothetical protein